MDSTSLDLLSQSADRKVRKLLGRSYLRENRLEEALEIYQGILRDYPDDLDTMLIFGELYRLCGCPETARHFYQHVLKQMPSHLLAGRQMAQVTEVADETNIEADPLSQDALSRLVERLRSEADDERLNAIRGVADLLERVAAEETLMGSNEQSKEELQQLLPALVDLNIRQARAAGQPELAEALQSLHIQLSKIISDREA